MYISYQWWANSLTHPKIYEKVNWNDEGICEVGDYISIDVEDRQVKLDQNIGYKITRAKQQKKETTSKYL